MNPTYEAITNKMIEALEAGIIPWQRPWNPTDAPRNIRGTHYRGVNKLLLQYEQIKQSYPRNIWLTPKQAIEMKGNFKGQKTTQVIFWKIGKAQDAQTGEERTTFLLRYYYVLNIAQVEGIDVPADPETTPIDPIEAAEEVTRNMPNAPKVQHGGDSAFYTSRADYVQMPPMDTFKTSAGYYSTLFHELAHSTGHPTRLGRFTPDHNHHFGSADYSKEELIAEMTQNFVCSEIGIDGDFRNSTAYIQSWIQVLKNDKTMLISAAAKAEKAADYIMNRKPQAGTDQTD